ncbi:predicted protein [Scheffersomyces stipitis CBS 6054]|uniref:Uncharacterized protein n=1 Tax=Scheffersomyces stipitis (strain ATCC 58785 / CBS 6054 / NBRC 10063 / NRRL Y-11545) TaxID=322104 RepID=A3LVA2_PICST|nr:predicted protein [Scheffersomyces stipitis CBS 6054]ABN67089.2 predicted protein [Scheffersomyces stipitis CBS 6054]KAG2734442.1 hypothetical protein G9P44_002448 [Scheffersomyces stipitis]
MKLRTVYLFTIGAITVPIYANFFANKITEIDITNKYFLPGINLDLLGDDADYTKINLDAQRYEEDVQEFSKHIVALRDKDTEFTAQETIIDLTDTDDSINFSQITKYKLSRREDLNEARMNYILETNPKGVVVFEDTKKVLVADPNDILYKSNDELKRRVEAGEKFKYTEVDLGNDFESQITYEPIMVPLTGCLKFPLGRGTGSVAFSYSVGLEMNINGEGGISYSPSQTEQNITVKLAISYSTNLKVTKRFSITGTHTCSSANGAGVRLFYRPGVLEVIPKTRNIIVDGLRRYMFNEVWQPLKAIKHLVDTAPIFYCGTEDKMNLRCGSPTITYVDKNGNDFKSTNYEH